MTHSPTRLARPRRLATTALLATTVLALVAPDGARATTPVAASDSTSLGCTGNPDAVMPLELTVQGQPASGIYAAPQDAPRGLVVFFHGYTETMESWRQHITRVADRDGVIAVAMDYRGLVPAPSSEPRPRSTGMPLVAGSQDGVAAAQAFDAACPGLPAIVAYGNSLGGGIAGLSVASGAKRADGGPLFDRLIATAGLSNLAEAWAELTAGSATAQAFFTQGKKDVEAETGGTPLTAPTAYLQRSSALRPGDIAASGVTAVTLVHGLADGTVPVNQSIEMALALTAAGVPVELILAGGRPAETASGTTLDATVLGLLGLQSSSPLAGHASDPDPNHVVAATGFARLSGIFDGTPAPRCLTVTFVDAAPDPILPGEPVCTVASQLDQVLRPATGPLRTTVLQPLTKFLAGLLGR